jgi:hypothetical protein
LIVAHHDRHDPALAKGITYPNLAIVNFVSFAPLLSYAQPKQDFASLFYGIIFAIFVCFINSVLVFLALIGLVRQVAIMLRRQHGPIALSSVGLCLQGATYVVVGVGFGGWFASGWKGFGDLSRGDQLVMVLQWLDSIGFAFLDNVIVGFGSMLVGLVCYWQMRKPQQGEEDIHDGERQPLLG